ncbi:Pathogenesis-related protein 1 [Bienertia sinuspersici]
MAISNNLILAIILVIELTITQITWDTISLDLQDQLKNPNINPNSHLVTLLTRLSTSKKHSEPRNYQPMNHPTTNPITPTVNNQANILHEDLSEFLIPQNVARAKVQTRSYAQERANECKLQRSHSPDKGENIARALGIFTPAKAVEMWLSKEANYDYGSNTCKKVCGHYTQVIWKNSTSISCAGSNC